jgi:hypothetical protein
LDVDVSLEPLGRGRATQRGDPLVQTLRPPRFLTSRPLGTTFDSFGLPTATIDTPGGAAANLADINGSYVSLLYDATTPLPAGIVIPSCTQRRWEPELIVVFRGNLVDGRLWVGLFTGDPAASNTLGSIIGAGVRVDASSDGNLYQFATSDGTTQTTVATAQAPAGNAIQAIRVRYLDATQGWECAFYDFTNNVWANHRTQAATGPLAATTLSAYVRLAKSTSTTNRAVSVKSVSLFQR